MESGVVFPGGWPLNHRGDYLCLWGTSAHDAAHASGTTSRRGERIMAGMRGNLVAARTPRLGRSFLRTRIGDHKTVAHTGGLRRRANPAAQPRRLPGRPPRRYFRPGHFSPLNHPFPAITGKGFACLKKEASLSSRRPLVRRSLPHPRAQRLAVDPKHIADILKREHTIGAIVEEPRGRFCCAPSLLSRV